MTTNRIYKPRQSIAEALQEIKRYAGTQFHPVVAEVAIRVLKDINICQTSQIANNELEQKRFSYFFCDSLTDLYNENYLQIALTNTEAQRVTLILCLLSNFSLYNKKYGWDEGNNLLITIAKILKTQFPQATVFRYHGDDFILLFDRPIVWDSHYFEQLLLLTEKGISVEVEHFDIPAGDYRIPF